MTIDHLQQRGQCGRFCPRCAADLGSETPAADPEHGLSEVDCTVCGDPAALSELLADRPAHLAAVWALVAEAEARLGEARRHSGALLAELRTLQQTYDEVTRA